MTDLARDPLIAGAEDEANIVTIRVWQVPIRIIHWVIFASIVGLSITGFYIGQPFLLFGSDPEFLMGFTRAVHQFLAWVFTAAVFSRIVFFFIGNRYANWRQFIPVERERRRDAREVLKYYLFLRSEPVPNAGHNPLAGVTYILVFVMLLIQIFTGFAMRDLATPNGFFQVLGGWLLAPFSAQGIRWTHHIIMWLIWGFAVHHVYAATLMDWEERSGLISSMISGRKRIPKDRL